MSTERAVARMRIDERHLQPMGLVHGGVYATVAETLASLGATLNAAARVDGGAAIGLENHTTFLRSAGDGTELVATARPQFAGRRTQVWVVTMVDEASGKELATSTVRLMVVNRNDYQAAG